tara:strand:- start:11509 stop:12930 length:1422 start_codon:yes stop_codon:yes gene_type:complete
MKKFALLLFFIGGLVSAQAQDSISMDSINKTNKGLLLKLGLNLVDSTGEYNPFELLSSFDEMAFSENFNIELEYRFSNSLSLSAAWSANKWKANKGKIDGSIITSDIKYSAIDLDLKYYFDEAFGGWFDRNDWLELYLHTGVGRATQATQSGTTFNFGSGATIWFSDRFGLNFNGTGKWMSNNGDELYNSNHFQYSTSLMYRFNKKDKGEDSDGDGVSDALDECPEEYGEDNGCPKSDNMMEADTDGDSVLDSVDNCPKIKGLPTNNGCPLPDSDNDGIVDVADKCPNVPGIESNNGCPYPESGAGIADSNIKNELSSELLPDADSDGVPDVADKCPTVAGIAMNNGCPYEEIMIGTTDTNLNRESKGILFNSGNANFRQDSYPILIKIAEMMKQYPEAKFKIEGHTDSVGPYQSNKRLSQTRANAVRNYLISSDIPSENLTAEGFGETRPVASNLTKEGQRLNRRVEIIRIK